MPQLELNEALLENGIENVNFFNGRILFAQDLQDEQKANLKHHKQLGIALGAGIVQGLRVDVLHTSNGNTPASVSVSAGLAVNRKGQALELPVDVEVKLVPNAETTPAETSIFKDCTSSETDFSPTGTGAYLLTMRPAADFRELAPKGGFSDQSKSNQCGFRYVVEGVEFKLAKLELANLADESSYASDFAVPANVNDWPAWSKLRNALAHALFRLNVKAILVENPFELTRLQTEDIEYGIHERLARVTGNAIDACDAPLALIFWSDQGIRFVDNWSVRRRLRASVADQLWPLHSGQDLLPGQEAMFLQFQEQLEWLRNTIGSQFKSLTVAEYFCFLPPVGYLPTGAAGFNPTQFFGVATVDQEELDTAFWNLLFQQSLLLEPFRFNEGSYIRLYSRRGLDADEYRLFVRAEPPLQAQETAMDEEDVPEPQQPSAPAATGRVIVTLDVSKVAKKDLTGLELDRNVWVWAEDGRGEKHWPKPLPDISFPGRSAGGKNIDATAPRLQIAKLVPGNYRVWLKASGFREQNKQVALSAGGTARVVFKLSKMTAGGGKKVDKPVDVFAGKVGRDWYDKLHIRPKQLRWPWPPKEIQDRGGIVDPPPEEVEDWLIQWGEWIAENEPQAPVAVGDIGIYIDPAHVPGAISEGPHAYAVFGKGGAYAPLTLVPSGKSIGRSVPAEKAGISGVDAYTADRLKQAGLNDLDVLAASSAVAVADALGVGLDTAKTLIREAGEKIAGFQGGLLMFSGVDSALAEKLAGIDLAGGFSLDNPIALANADPAVIVAELEGESGVSLGFAMRLVDEARSIVPEAEWSLNDERLGMTAGERAALKDAGITTKAGLAKLGESEQGRQQLANLIGADSAQVEALVGEVAEGLNVARVEYRAESKRSAPVTEIFGIDRDSGERLAEIGLGSVAALARGDSAVVASAVGGNVEVAERLIGRANEYLR